MVLIWGGELRGDAMKILLTLLFFVFLGFAIVGLIHSDSLIVLTNFTKVKHDAELNLLFPFLPLSLSLCYMTEFARILGTPQKRLASDNLLIKALASELT